MSLFLLGYALGLKDKIRSIMRTLLISTGVMIMMIAMQSYTSAADLDSLIDDRENHASASTVPNGSFSYYMKKLLSLESIWDTHPAFTPANTAFYELIVDELENKEQTEHASYLLTLITNLEEHSATDLKAIYGINKSLMITLLTAVYEFSTDNPQTHWSASYASPTDHESAYLNPTDVRFIGDLYMIDEITHHGTTYMIYTLRNKGKLKYATFHLNGGSTYTCMYDQCNKVAVSSAMKVEQIYLTFWNEINARVVEWWNTMTTQSSSTTTNKRSSYSSRFTSTTTTTTPANTQWTSPTSPSSSTSTSSTSTTTNAEEELMEAMSEIFGGIF